MVHRQKVNLVLTNPIDYAVAPDYDLSDVLDPQFRNGSPQAWIARQPIRSAKDSVGEGRRQLRGVSSNKRGWRIHCLSCMRLTNPLNISVNAFHPWAVLAS